MIDTKRENEGYKRGKRWIQRGKMMDTKRGTEGK